MIVIDASALLELLLSTDRAKAVGAIALEPDERLHAHQELLPRIWHLRNAMTAYDDAYVVLAEALDAPLLTCDAKLGQSHGHRVEIEVVD